ncbi:MAG TPA: hypothetical protein VKS79_15980 [Gemmataceae bacterium]|nr:hypothetical protein [Gemmataceae bacterium]
MIRSPTLVRVALLAGIVLLAVSQSDAFAQRTTTMHPSTTTMHPSTMHPSQPVTHAPVNQSWLLQQQALMAATRHREHHEHHPWWWYRNWYWNPYWNPYLWYGGYAYGGSYGYPDYYSGPSYAPAPNYAQPAPVAPDGPTAEERQRRLEQVALDRALNNPPVNEVTSGASLNTILADLQRMGLDRGWKELPVTTLNMPADLLARINVSHSGNSSIGILRDWSHVTWPAAFSGPNFKLQRKQVDDLVQAAITRAKTEGQVAAEVLPQLSDNVNSLRQQLRDNTVNLTFSEHAEARSFLNQLQAGVTALREPDVKSFLTGQYQIKAKTIPELVQWMTEKGLQFAPVLPGDEAAYATLRGRLAAYDLALRATPAASAETPKSSYKVTP